MRSLLRKSARGWLAVLAVFCLMAVPELARAAYEIDKSKVNAGVPTDGNPFKWNQDITIEWEQPDVGINVLQGFVYKWNTVAAQLDDSSLNIDNAEGIVDKDVIPPYATKPASFFANDDSGTFRYLHIKTWYLDTATSNIAYSGDVVIGPINVDNVAPTGTVRIPNPDNPDQNLTSTRNPLLSLKLSASLDPVRVHLNEEPTRDTALTTVYASDATYDLFDPTPGQKTIYAWFEDSVGNISSLPATANITLLSAVSISPQTATIDLSGTNSQVFILDGTNAAHDWIILNPIPETSGQTVAQFSGSASGVSTVTLQGVEKGTFQLQATPTAGGDAVTSGTIQVVQRITHNLDVDGNGSADGLTDGLLIIRYLFGIPGDALIANAVAADSTRSSASEIENFLENATTAILDIDGNGTADGLTDGLLIIRYLFGIPGDALTAGAVSTDCTRCSAQEIEAYLEKLLP